MSLNINDYPVLSTYAILAGSGISTVKTTSVLNGFYGSSPTPTYTGTFNPSIAQNSTNAATAQLGLTSLINHINSLPTTTNIGTTISTGQIYTPGIYNSTSSITYTGAGASIIFNAQNNPDAKFVIRADQSITFTNIPSIALINGAKNCNVFWLAKNASISFASPSLTNIPGIFIAGASITFTPAPKVSGRVYAKAAVTFDGAGNPSVNALCTPVPVNPVIPDDLPLSNICFLGNTPITTDQGDILIKDIDTNIHTIGNESIVAITRTISLDEYLVCFKANSLDENYPVKQTIVSKDHKILYKGQMIEARKFVDKFTNVLKVKYDREVLYNVLMEKYSTICVNNLVCETLNPENIISKIYTNKTIKDKNLLISELNKMMLKNHRENKKINTIKQINRM